MGQKLLFGPSLTDQGFAFSPWGAVAQLGERLVRNEEASGSIPLSSTILGFIRLFSDAVFKLAENFQYVGQRSNLNFWIDHS